MQKLSLRSTLMNSLYYPAVLGTGIVLVLNRLAAQNSIGEAITDISNYWGVLLLAYFSVSFLVNHMIPADNYGKLAFAADLAEVILIFLAFFFLGYFAPSTPHAGDIQGFYFVLAAVPLCQQVWNYSVAYRERTLLAFSMFVSFTLLIGGAWGYQHIWFNVSVIIVMAGMLTGYIHYLTVQDPS